jgi:hypothetical protein
MRGTLLAVVALLAGCVGVVPRVVPRVVVAPTGNALSLAPRPHDCAVEFYRTRPPERAYDEIATLHLEGHSGDAPAAQERMRARACELGADAVVVTGELLFGRMVGVALSYRDLRDRHRVDAALRATEEARVAAELEAELKAAAASPAGAAALPPRGFVRGRARTSLPVRATPEATAKELELVAGGADVWMAPQPSGGWRRVWVPGGAAGWVEEDGVYPLDPAPSPAPPAPPAPPERDAPERISI